MLERDQISQIEEIELQTQNEYKVNKKVFVLKNLLKNYYSEISFSSLGENLDFQSLPQGL